jgi:hypothetical protein
MYIILIYMYQCCQHYFSGKLKCFCLLTFTRTLYKLMIYVYHIIYMYQCCQHYFSGKLKCFSFLTFPRTLYKLMTNTG